MNRFLWLFLLAIFLSLQSCSTMALSQYRDRVHEYRDSLAKYRTYGWTTSGHTGLIGRIVQTTVDGEMEERGYKRISVILPDKIRDPSVKNSITSYVWLSDIPEEDLETPDLQISLIGDIKVLRTVSGSLSGPYNSLKIRIWDPKLKKPLREGVISSGKGLIGADMRYNESPDDVEMEIQAAVSELLRGFPAASKP